LRNLIPATLSFELFEVNVIKCCEIGDNPRAMLYVKIRDGRWYDEVLEVPEERGEDGTGPDRLGGFDRLIEFEAWKKSEGLDTPEKYEAWEKEREKQSNLWLMHQARAKNRYLERHGPIYGLTTRYRDDGTAFTVDLGAPDRRDPPADVLRRRGQPSSNLLFASIQTIGFPLTLIPRPHTLRRSPISTRSNAVDVACRPAVPQRGATRRTNPPIRCELAPGRHATELPWG